MNPLLSTPTNLHEESLIQWINQNLANNYSLFDILEVLYHSGTLKKLIENVLENDVSLNNILDRSTIHPSGLIKIIILGNDFDQPELKFHFWPKIVSLNGIHNHYWDFASVIINDNLINYIYSYNKEGEKYSSVVFTPRTFRDGSNIHDKNSTENLKLSYINKMSKGDIYFQSHEHLHKVEPLGKTPITCLLRGKYINESINVYIKNKPKESKNKTDVARKLTIDDLKDKLLFLLSII